MDPFMFAVLLLVLGFIAVVLHTILRWQGVWRVAASLPLVVLGVAILNILLYPTSHNLLPFELIVWVLFGSIVLGIVSAVRLYVQKKAKDEGIHGKLR